MKWITLFLHLISMRKSFLDSRALVESAQAVATRGKRYAASFAALALAGLFLFTALVVAVIDLGQQIEKGYLVYSGLLISSTIFLGISACFVLLSYFWSRSTEPPPPPPPPPSPLKDLLEEFLVSFFSQLKDRPRPPSGAGPK